MKKRVAKNILVRYLKHCLKGHPYYTYNTFRFFKAKRKLNAYLVSVDLDIYRQKGIIPAFYCRRIKTKVKEPINTYWIVADRNVLKNGYVRQRIDVDFTKWYYIPEKFTR